MLSIFVVFALLADSVIFILEKLTVVVGSNVTLLIVKIPPLETVKFSPLPTLKFVCECIWKWTKKITNRKYLK